jgi:hypothetical protein
MTLIRFFNQIKTMQTIPRCVDCKYYLLKDSYANNRCVRVIYNCPDTSVTKFEYAYIARANETLCGPKGANFVLKIKDIK